MHACHMHVLASDWCRQSICIYIRSLIAAKFWPPPSPVALRHVDLPLLPIHLTPGCLVLSKWAVEWGSWHNFLFQKGRQKAFSILTCRRHFPYLRFHPYAPHPAGSPGRSNTKSFGGEKEICYSYLGSHPQLLCTHYHSPSSYKKCGVSNMGWIWPILLIPTELPTVFYRTSNIAEALKGKQTGGLLLKNMLKFYRHIISDNVHRKYKKSVWGGSKQTLIKFSFIT